MIIRRVAFSNFGIYGGDYSFNLTPIPSGNFNRPIVLFSGKNGVGKTTLVEAIRLCLHGPLALGSRVSRPEYYNYLLNCIHRPLDPTVQPNSAKVEILLDYVRFGRKHTYRIERSWHRVRNKVVQEVFISEDEETIQDLSPEQSESFLRELVPPSAADLFFFDGEKLQMLAEDNTGNSLLSNTVKGLLGLNLVEQLKKDLDIYISRQMTNNNHAILQTQLDELIEKISEVERERESVQAKQQTNREEITKIQGAIAEQEQKIASEGSWFADQLDALKMNRHQLELEIEKQRRRAQDLSNGLMPFAIASQFCRFVAERLEMEREYERWVASQLVLDSQLKRISVEITSPEFWADMGLEVDERARHMVFTKIEAALKPLAHPPGINPDQIILQVSERERCILLSWIEQSLTEIPQQFCQAISMLKDLEKELDHVKQKLLLVPADETLKPLVETLNSLNQKLGALQKRDEDLIEQLRRLDYELEQANHLLRRTRQEIMGQEKGDQRIQLAAKTQLVLERYAADLIREKVARLESSLVIRFNDLCRKKGFIDAAKIDPDDFTITFYRAGQPFERNQLSAGEKQLLAVAMVWALREVSGLPIPVIIDTPLGRLDSDHRHNMVQSYFPRASHQVILLTTDTEIELQTLPKLAPAISHAYYLQYDPTLGTTTVTEDCSLDLYTPQQEKMAV